MEEFDTDLKLPEWRLEPDEEYLFGDPDDYYFIDEQGNLIEPGRREQDDGLPFGIEGERPDLVPPANVPSPALEDPPSAASDDFLDRATAGQGAPPNDSPPAPPRQPPPLPRPTQGAGAEGQN